MRKLSFLSLPLLASFFSFVSVYGWHEKEYALTKINMTSSGIFGNLISLLAKEASK